MKTIFRAIIEFFVNLFNNNSISDIEVNEPKEVKPEIVPLTKEYLVKAVRRKKAYRNGSKKHNTTKSFNNL